MNENVTDFKKSFFRQITNSLKSNVARFSTVMKNFNWLGKKIENQTRIGRSKSNLEGTEEAWESQLKDLAKDAAKDVLLVLTSHPEVAKVSIN